MGEGDTSELAGLFNPSSVAVVGASNRPGAVGQLLFRNLLSAGYRGVVYPVNPSSKSISGVRCYRDVAALPEAPELGIVIVQAPLVPPVVADLGRRGTRNVIVISAGFRELGERGAPLEEELVRVAKRHRIALVGPNCFGVFNTDPNVGLNATFSGSLPPRGRIGFISQSGALGAGILRYGVAERIGFSQFVSMGNRAGLDENDFLREMGGDPATDVVLLYIESLANGRRFLQTALEVTERKPVLVIKSGRTPAGERAARSHTGALARSGQDRLYDALFEQSGAIRVDSIGELFRAAKVFASGSKMSGRRLAILTNSGGPGIVAADACARQQLPLVDLGARAQRQLGRWLSPSASVSNPVDMTADGRGKEYARSLRLLLSLPQVDGAIVISTPTSWMPGAEVARAILEGRGTSPKPVVACMFGLTDLSREVGFLEDKGVPTFTFPEEAVQGVGYLARYHAWRARRRTEVRHFDVDIARARSILRSARRSGATVLPEYAARELLKTYGIGFPTHGQVRTLGDALATAVKIGFPVVLKVESPDISHKTDVGGVALGIGSAGELERAWNAMRSSVAARAPGARIEGFEVQQEISQGKEVLIGFQRDPDFGPVLVFGLGGIYVEVLRDVTFRLAPIVTRSAELMVESIRAFPLLQGVRGEPASDLPALYEALERISQLAVDLPEIQELDLNPMIVGVHGRGVVAVDARVVLAGPSRSEPRPSAGRSGSAPPRTRRAGGGPTRRR